MCTEAINKFLCMQMAKMEMFSIFLSVLDGQKNIFLQEQIY